MMDYSITGFLVGVLVGVTGMGGALVMTPLLIIWFHMNPETAVGTDLAYAFVTKAVGAVQHMRQKTVDFFAVRWLSYGTVPGALMGSLAVAGMMHYYPMNQVNRVVSTSLGVVYVIVIGTLAYQWFVRKHPGQQPIPRFLKTTLVALGVLTGFIVGFTSVGSGSLYIAVLAILYPIPAARLVGTDLVQSVLMTGIAAFTHWAIGTVDLTVLGYLLIGSIPGILIGSKLMLRVPNSLIRVFLILLLCWSSFNMLSI